MNILLAVDHSDASRKAVEFVADVVGKRTGDEARVTVFHVVESLPEFILTRKTQGGLYEKLADEWAEVNRAAGEKLLAETEGALVSAGLAKAAVETKLVLRESRPEAKKVVAAIAIIEEMKAGPYTVVCVGRRGTSLAGSPDVSPFPGSVAEKVLRQARGKTVWVVD